MLQVPGLDWASASVGAAQVETSSKRIHADRAKRDVHRSMMLSIIPFGHSRRSLRRLRQRMSTDILSARRGFAAALRVGESACRPAIRQPAHAAGSIQDAEIASHYGPIRSRQSRAATHEGRDRMLRNPPRLALVLLASLAGLLIAGAVARSEPAASASPSADADCLAKPNAPSASGNHWYYRIERSSGRHCWYQRPETGATNDVAQARPSSRALVSPIDKPVPDAPADRLSAPRNRDRDQNAVEPAAAAPAQPSWSTAAPPPAPPEQIAPTANDSVMPAPAVAPQPDTLAEPPRIEPAPAATIRKAFPEPPAALASDDTHMPALFGAAVALVIIVLGSIVARLAAKLIRSRRRRGVASPAVSMPPPFLRAQDTPALVPPMPPEDDITREAHPPPWLAPRAPAARREGATSADAAPRNRDSARELEQNVRELLHRMRGELQRTSGAAADPPPRSPQELDETLAAWRGGRRRPVPR